MIQIDVIFVLFFLLVSLLVFRTLICFGFICVDSQVHDFTLYEFSFRSSNDRVFHTHNLTIDIQKDRRCRLDYFWNQRVLDKLKVEFLSRSIGHHNVVMCQVEL